MSRTSEVAAPATIDLLIATDGTRDADGAVRVGRALALRDGAVAELVSVVEPFPLHAGAEGVPLPDVHQLTTLMTESRAAELGVKPDRIGVMGFSAGGHLASSAATLFDLADARAKDGLEAVSSRPDFAILGYPVIVFGADVTHKGSQQHLLGDTPSADLVVLLSTDRQVTAKTPPTFLFHTNEDAGVPPQNSVAFYLALKNAGVPAELHIYEKGAHGVGLAPADRELSTWPDRMLGWMRGRGLMN